MIDNAREMETINISGIKAGTYYWRVNKDNKKKQSITGKPEKYFSFFDIEEKLYFRQYTTGTRFVRETCVHFILQFNYPLPRWRPCHQNPFSYSIFNSGEYGDELARFVAGHIDKCVDLIDSGKATQFHHTHIYYHSAHYPYSHKWWLQACIQCRS